ncbi:glycosyltransferase [Cellulomonas fimi]|uniref:Glycosyl transferase group 1 n=1 Tax=Cellulomonas fimi (strain ATCC 484 / DSM 20113 / JCM 1341 / CCUG 24087 / LMG 16345 / NBRC 15513 / NCIMB 8980 / NCTC 7547 / NRS-133) TaxID=590998 RepID=F4GZ45_CELFA|nr:glycosyltransferase [Cellulomonas fimi]AEE47161.1 glycosyl transferase group 1 [Cellulomonas fimi ATCC 484]NNH07702.1 glycosyltransferase family 4 protein [Cellulomonas fimi]VEH35447.1 glycosyltransferase, MSMEG_0565 family [Cellulomonas fimi]
MTTTSRTAARAALPRVRLYETVRTAHLERAHELAPASIVYRRRRYDFDDDLARGLDLVEAGPLRAARVLLRSDVRELEINEPLMVSSLRRTALALAAVDLRRLLRRPRTLVVTYAIANDDPFRPPARPGLRGRLRRLLDARLIALVARRVDRVVLGTPAAQELYAARVPGLLAHAEHVLLPALPTACGCGPLDAHDPDEVLFVGAFEERKGVPQLLAAWPLVHAARPTARLTLVGKGPLADDVHRFAAERPEVTVVVDPPRPQVHARQRRAAVAVLLSQRTRTWREQVGLPVVEGLAHGCAVLTTTETGLASWLREHGHGVVEPTAAPADVAAALLALLDRRRPAADVLADLPDVDGRLAADTWLLRAR